MENNCFASSEIQKLFLPSSVESIGESSFDGCKHLKYVDLSAAHGLKSISVSAFFSCKALKQVLLNEGLETIGKYSFTDCGLERLFVPGSVRFIG